MKAILIILACIALSFILKVIDYFTNRKDSGNTGSKTNVNFKDMPKVDINNKEELQKALDYYKYLSD